MSSAILTSKGQITIPVSVRNDLKVDAGDRVEFIQIAPGRYEFVAATHNVNQLKGMFGKPAKAISVDVMNKAIARLGAAAIKGLTSKKMPAKFSSPHIQEPVVKSFANIRSISYLKSHAGQISEDLQLNGSPLVITQNGESSLSIESVQQFQGEKTLITILKIIALGEKDRQENKGLTAEESREKLGAARQRGK